MDSHFAAVLSANTPAEMEVLRQAGIQFDVSVNPNRPPDEVHCDGFWFWKTEAQYKVQAAITKALNK